MRHDNIRRDAAVRNEPDLKKIVSRLTRLYEPEAIFLFGSKARGDAGPDSDYDLLLVIPDDAPAERRRSQLAYKSLWETGPHTAVDVLICTRSWFNARRHLKASLPGTVLREGLLLHGA